MNSFILSKEQYCDLMKLDRVNAVNLFLYLLANADEEGTLIVSIRKISTELNMGLWSIRTLLKSWYSTHKLTHQLTHKGSVITINNIDSYKPKVVEIHTPTHTPTHTVKERSHTFGEKLIPFMEQYGSAMIREFFDYWTECNEGGQKMRFEKEKTFDISRRLARWKKNNYNKSNLSAEQKIHQDGTILHKGQMDVTKGGWTS